MLTNMPCMLQGLCSSALSVLPSFPPKASIEHHVCKPVTVDSSDQKLSNTASTIQTPPVEVKQAVCVLSACSWLQEYKQYGKPFTKQFLF